MVGSSTPSSRPPVTGAGRPTRWAQLTSAGTPHTEAQAAWDEQVARGRLVHIATLL